MVGTNLYYRATLNMDEKTLALTKGSDPDWKANSTFERVDEDHLTIDGDIDGHRTHASLMRFDESNFLLKNRGFHWVQELPFNR
jgi:hypothetical protein